MLDIKESGGVDPMLFYYVSFGGVIWIILQVSSDQRERLTMSVERLNESSDRIRESHRAVLETEELGVSILQDLHQQRETLLSSHKRVLDMQTLFCFKRCFYMSSLDTSCSPFFWFKRITDNQTKVVSFQYNECNIEAVMING